MENRNQHPNHSALLFAAVVLLSGVLLASPARALLQVEFVQEIGDPLAKKNKRMFTAPRAVAAAGDRYFVADTDANRVVVMDLNGKVLHSWGEKGSKPGQFRSPAGIAVDGSGTVFVSDTGNHRIQVFNGEGKHLRVIGSKGSGPRDLDGPAGLEVVNDLLYVADAGNHRVLVLTVEGIAMGQINDAQNSLKEPIDVNVDSRNWVYVLDAAAQIVVVFNDQGIPVARIGAATPEAPALDSPGGIAVDKFGNLYITDTGNAKLKKYDAGGALVASAGSQGSGPGQFQKPTGVTIDQYNRPVILDAEKNTLQVFTTERNTLKPLPIASPPPTVAVLRQFPGRATALAVGGQPWALLQTTVSELTASVPRTFGAAGSKPGQLEKARGLAVDKGWNLWVADTGNDRVQKFGPDGSFLQSLGEDGSHDGQFDEPSGIAVSVRDKLFVADTGNERIQVFSARGVFLNAFGKSGKLPGQFSEPVDVAVDSSENFYVADRGNHRIAKFDPNGKLLWEAGKRGSNAGDFERPENIAVSPDGEVYVLDGGNCRIQVFSGDGKFLRLFGSEGTAPGMFREPIGMALQDGLYLYVGDRGNERVQAFTLRHTTAVPQGVSARERPNEIQINWKPNKESYADGYAVYRADSSSDEFTLLGTTHDVFFNDRNLPSNKTFRYRVSGRAREGHESAFSEPLTVTTPKLVPAEPKNLIVEAREKQVVLSWLPNTEPFISHYRIYRKSTTGDFEKIGKADQPTYVDKPLEDETEFTYRITAVGKEDDESPASAELTVVTPKSVSSVPPLDMEWMESSSLFASAYKYYESHPLGKVLIKNNTDADFTQVKLSFSIKNFMDFPTEQIIEKIAAKDEVLVSLHPVLNNKILEVTENTPLQSEIALTYFMDGVANVLSRTFPLTLYERHAMTWDRKENIGAFVTPKDPAVVDFTRGVIQQYVDSFPVLPSSLVYARAIYDSLGVLGLTYIVDPTSPFQEFSEKAASVDYLQYPRDTLARKSGDCDDLSVLFAASLENIGIGTALVDVPGHVFVIFNTGVASGEKGALGVPESSVVAHRGTWWVPVEMTMVGSSFTKAWQRAADQYLEWSSKGKTEIIELQKAWERFRPVTLPPDSTKTPAVKREQIEAKFPGETEALIQQRLELLSAAHLAALQKDPNDTQALIQLGILYGEHGKYQEALEQFQKLLALDQQNALALNNSGNVYFLQERLDDARQAYEAALKADPTDAGILVNLSRTLLRSGKKNDAKNRFLEAVKIDPRVSRRQPDLASELGVK